MIEAALGKKKPLIDREIIALAVILLFLPFVLPYKSLTPEILIYALGAVAFNILLGYTGMLSFGQGALFGVGAYMTGLMLIHMQMHPLLAILCGCFIGAATAFIIGFFAIRQVGIYFVMLTLAFNQLVFFIIYQWKGLTGGDDGLLDVPRPDFSIFPGIDIPIQTNLQFFLFVWVIFILAVIVIRRILNSSFGRVLVAIKENPDRAAAIGYNIQHYKLAAFVVSGFFTGLAGGLYALFMRMVPITAVELFTSTDFIIMSLLGGLGSLYGPIVGAVIIKIASEIVSAIWARWLMVMGVTFIVCILFMPGGVWGLVTAVIEKRKAASMQTMRSQ
ncbi:MAG: branched-chain amino acid ABC transporter permease [Desulfobacteraceae bacterium]|jgi:branched-chain amino acid transport system permease protein|nr:branched-chain amino acid ABC transporter permease [Desulfobacteraceae bacterium]